MSEAWLQAMMARIGAGGKKKPAAEDAPAINPLITSYRAAHPLPAPIRATVFERARPANTCDLSRAKPKDVVRLERDRQHLWLVVAKQRKTSDIFNLTTAEFRRQVPDDVRVTEYSTLELEEQ